MIVINVVVWTVAYIRYRKQKKVEARKRVYISKQFKEMNEGDIEIVSIIRNEPPATERKLNSES